MLAWFGNVEMSVDGRHNFTTGTALATCLLMVDERGSCSNSDLAECMGGVDSSLLRKVIQPLLDSTLLVEMDGKFKVESSSAIVPNKLSLALSSAESYTDLVASTQVTVTLDKDMGKIGSSAASGS